jgi:hypothetical protein
MIIDDHGKYDLFARTMISDISLYTKPVDEGFFFTIVDEGYLGTSWTVDWESGNKKSIKIQHLCPNVKLFQYVVKDIHTCRVQLPFHCHLFRLAG